MGVFSVVPTNKREHYQLLHSSASRTSELPPMNCEVRPSPMSPHSRDSLEQAFVYILAERCRENAIRRQVYNSLIFLLIYHDNSFYVESGVGVFRF